MKLFDTAVLVDHFRGRAEATDTVYAQVALGEAIASEVVRFELLAGVRESEIAELELLFDSVSWAPVDEPIARRAGELARIYRPSHSGIDDVDYLIAATAIELDADLVTTNVRHYPMLPGLEPPY